MDFLYRQGDSYIINGNKWWTSGAMDPRCRVLIVMVSSSKMVWHEIVLFVIHVVEVGDLNQSAGEN